MTLRQMYYILIETTAVSVICLGNTKLNGGSRKSEMAKAEKKTVGPSLTIIRSACPASE